MNSSFVKLDKSNLKAAIALQKKVFPNEPGEADLTLGATGKMAENQSHLEYWLYLEKGKALGIVGLYAYKKYPRDAWLGWFCTDPSFRGKGLGSALFDFAKQKARELGFRSLRLYTDDQDNAGAVKFYQHKGMTSEIYSNKKDTWLSIGNTLIFSVSLIDDKPAPLWRNKYLALSDHEELNAQK